MLHPDVVSDKIIGRLTHPLLDEVLGVLRRIDKRSSCDAKGAGCHCVGVSTSPLEGVSTPPLEVGKVRLSLFGFTGFCRTTLASSWQVYSQLRSAGGKHREITVVCPRHQRANIYL